jgi:hypothetical protein
MPRAADEDAEENEARKGEGRREQLGFAGAGGEVTVTCNVRRKSRHCRRGTKRKKNREARVRLRPAKGCACRRGVHGKGDCCNLDSSKVFAFRKQSCIICSQGRNSKGNEAGEEQRGGRALGY